MTGCAAQNLYAPDYSDVCLSAAHAGLMTSAGGSFEVKIANAGIYYQGCTANGLSLICDHIDLHSYFI